MRKIYNYIYKYYVIFKRQPLYNFFINKIFTLITNGICLGPYDINPSLAPVGFAVRG